MIPDFIFNKDNGFGKNAGKKKSEDFEKPGEHETLLTFC